MPHAANPSRWSPGRAPAPSRVTGSGIGSSRCFESSARAAPAIRSTDSVRRNGRFRSRGRGSRRVSRLGEAVRPCVPSIDIGSENPHKENLKRTDGTKHRLRYRHEEADTGRAAAPDRSPRREPGTVSNQCGCRGHRQLDRRRIAPGKGACRGRSGGHRVCHVDLLAPARTGPVVHDQGWSLSPPLSTRACRPRARTASVGDGPGG